jgi:dipeptidyl aminopeptidase/acylaminoacyl peptidase
MDTATGALTQVGDTGVQVSYGDAIWSHDGSGIYLTSDQGGEFTQLWYHDISTGKESILTGDIPWDVSEMALSPDGAILAFITNADGIGQLHLMTTATGRWEALPGLPAGQISGMHFNPDGTHLAFTLNTAQTPGDAYVLDMRTHALERWTHSSVGGLATDSFIVPELIRFPTFDSLGASPRTIPAFYYRPAKSSGPLPVLVYIHGGPESQITQSFSGLFQYLVNELGIAVITPNVRGSTGYGKSYLTLDDGRRREDAVRDIGALLDWVGTRPELDAKRVGVMGRSYGGYMVLAALTHFSDRLACGVDIVGISNYVTFLSGTSGYRQDLRRVEYGDERDSAMNAFLQRISPLTNAGRITRPLMVVQGKNDPRVPVREAEQIVAAVKKNGVPVWYLLANDEGHGFRKKKNEDYCTAASATFLKTFLAR